MVVFKNGLPSKKDYRKFKMSIEKNDDYHMMREVIYRRYFRVLTEDKTLPDLIVLDGGVNQINACRESLKELGLNLNLCGLKKDNHHKTKTLINGSTMEEIDLSHEKDVFNLLTRIQDEVHNFTINYHKQIRSKGTIGSVLENIEGIGEKRKKELLKKYKSLEKIKNAPLEELSKLLPLEVAKKLVEYLKEI